MGIAPSNILWDGQTATLIQGDKVVQVTKGSKIMLVNSTPVTMDTVPEISDGRAMLPFRWIARALNVTVNYDEASKTVDISLQGKT